jgi:hypothetical protein
LRDGGHSVRGTTRDERNLPAIEAAGAEGAVADPDRLGTLLPHIEGVTVLYWLMGGASGPVHGPRLQSMLETLVDTPVRGFVYEGTEEGAQLVRAAAETFRIPVAVLDRDHPAWLEEAASAADRVLARP